MERKAYWYSIIQYCPNEIRGEKINVGVMLHNYTEGKLFHSILDENTTKIKSLLYDEISTKVYKIQKDEVDFYFKQMYEEFDLFKPNLYEKNYLSNLLTIFPKQFILSEPTFSMSRDADQLFDSLFKTYIGEITSKEVIKDIPTINVKNYTKSIFTDNNWIGTKVKSNVKIHPIKDLQNMHFQVDFVFKNGIWNLIQATPSNTSNDKLIEWFSKTKTMLSSYQRESDVYLIYNKDDQMNEDNTLSDMVTYLQKEDNRVKLAEIKSPSFENLCHKVEKEAKDITQFESELIAM
ncbi:DUF3037 domain-containing protein [Paenibacillus amylolyticus]|uniref:DUF3037 domain-containing protein n=1 Tax=Paenibacillus amylolyticus TaxID=1451 RepID=UPI000FD923A7|nr:DUF3037 domain-containing protein [Paenibacillus amylolyticus]